VDRTIGRAGEARRDFLEPVVGPHSMLVTEGEEWLEHRKLLGPAFHRRVVDDYREEIAAIARAEIERFPTGRPFELRPHMQAITLEVILRLVFGLSVGARIERLRELLRELLAAASSPLLLLIPPKVFLFAGNRRRFRRTPGPLGQFLRARDEADALLYEEIRERRAAGRTDGTDALSIMVADGGLTDEAIRDELHTLLQAGHETTATALAWAVELLLAHPDKLAALRADLPDGDEYLNAVIHETMRLRPPIPLFDRLVCEPIEVLGHRIPKGTVMACNIVSAHRRADVYPDPLEFRPERFLDNAPDTYSWIPFGGGIRRCLGAAFALYEMRIVLRMVVERTQPHAIDPQPSSYFRRAIVLGPRSQARVALPA
jgi:cytochrome P450